MVIAYGGKFGSSASDYHSLQSLQNYLDEKFCNSLEDCKRYLKQFYAGKDKLWKDEMMKLPVKRQKIVEQLVDTVLNTVNWKIKNTILFVLNEPN